MSDRIYLDYNATAPLRPEAAAAMAEALRAPGNPSSVHGFGRAARRLVEDARDQVAALIGAAPAQVVFTSGGTEANNLALRGADVAAVLTSSIEHDSVLAAAPTGRRLPVDGDGVLRLAGLAEIFRQTPGPAVVSVMLANNETGVVQPVAEVSSLAHARGHIVHCDAVQAAGKLPVDIGALGVDLLSLSAHKIGGPAGVGALVLAADIELTPQLQGGGQERRRRAGTENVAGIVGFGVAAELAAADAANTARPLDLRDHLETRIKATTTEARIYGAAAPRLPNTSCIELPGVGSDLQVMKLDLAGFAVSAGAACSSGKVTPSHVLRAMGAGAEAAGNAIRVSTGWATTAAEIDRFVAAWRAMTARLTPAPRKAAA